jgi:hypothetical protein
MGPGLVVPEVAVVRRRWALDRLEPTPEQESARKSSAPIPVGSQTAILPKYRIGRPRGRLTQGARVSAGPPPAAIRRLELCRMGADDGRRFVRPSVLLVGVSQEREAVRQGRDRRGAASRPTRCIPACRPWSGSPVLTDRVGPGRADPAARATESLRSRSAGAARTTAVRAAPGDRTAEHPDRRGLIPRAFRGFSLFCITP